MKKVYTLCVPHQGSKVLLGMKKLSLGAGRWNGFGGKVEPGETIEAAARREVQEEIGIKIGNMEKLGILDFEILDAKMMLEVHVFKAHDFEGDPVGTPEMDKPQWFDAGKIPFEAMWLDDKFWFPLFLDGKKFKGRFLFQNDAKLLEIYLTEVSEL